MSTIKTHRPFNNRKWTLGRARNRVQTVFQFFANGEKVEQSNVPLWVRYDLIKKHKRSVDYGNGVNYTKRTKYIHH